MNIHVGLSAWIIMDGNYDDFGVGQEVDFALEFCPLGGLRPSRPGEKAAEHLGASRYRIRAEVVFLRPGVWVIDAGAFTAFHESEPPKEAAAGGWVEGELYLGIDPFFYFEYLHREDGIPPLTYTWRVNNILRETTPWIDLNDASGRPYRARDESRESFIPTQRTAAWQEDGGVGHYVLDCARFSGPRQPGG